MEKFEHRQMRHDFKKVFDLNLESLYSQCNTEMAYQQSKRDQTIAFYIAIISFLVPAIMEMALNTALFAVVYGVLWLVGWMLSGVVRRYRIYKECYWITLRTISTLQRVNEEKLDKESFQKTYAATLRLNRPNVVIAKKGVTVYPPEEVTDAWLEAQAGVSYKKQIDYWKTWRKNSTSAEYLLYMLIVLISSLMMAMAVFYGASWVLSKILPDLGLLSIGLGVVAAALCICVGIGQYVRDLAEVYAYCFDYQKKSFNKPYTKAWFLHCFNSELEPEEETDDSSEKKQVPTGVL